MQLCGVHQRFSLRHLSGFFFFFLTLEDTDSLFSLQISDVSADNSSSYQFLFHIGLFVFSGRELA